MKVSFIRAKKAAHNIYTFQFATPAGFTYTAGQFTELRIPHDNKDSRGDKRWFTLSSSPLETELSITTKLASSDGSSFKQALRSLKPGAEVYMSMPMGDFVLPRDHGTPIIFVAGGIGSTPYRSMLTYARQQHEERPISMLYNASTPAAVAFKDTFGSLGSKFTTIVGRRLKSDQILQLTSATGPEHIYLSGPKAFTDAMKQQLRDAGIGKSRLHADVFPGYNS